MFELLELLAKPPHLLAKRPHLASLVALTGWCDQLPLFLGDLRPVGPRVDASQRGSATYPGTDPPGRLNASRSDLVGLIVLERDEQVHRGDLEHGCQGEQLGDAHVLATTGL